MSLFKAIQRDPDVCNNCFRRTHHRYELNYAIRADYDRSDDEYELWPQFVDHGEQVLPYADNTTKVPDGTPAHGMSSVCDCGVAYRPPDELDEGETWKLRPLSKKMLFEVAERLADRAEEEVGEANIDRRGFFDELSRLKSDPDEQFADDRILAQALNRNSTTPHDADDGHKQRV